MRRETVGSIFVAGWILDQTDEFRSLQGAGIDRFTERMGCQDIAHGIDIDQLRRDRRLSKWTDQSFIDTHWPLCA